MELRIILKSNDRDAIKRTSWAVRKALNEAGVWYEGPFASVPIEAEATQLKYEGWYKVPVPVIIKIYQRSYIANMTPQGIARLNQIKIPDTVEITFETITEEDEHGK